MSEYRTIHLLVSEEENNLTLARQFYQTLNPDSLIESFKCTKNALEYLNQTFTKLNATHITDRWLLDLHLEEKEIWSFVNEVSKIPSEGTAKPEIQLVVSNENEQDKEKLSHITNGAGVRISPVTIKKLQTLYRSRD